MFAKIVNYIVESYPYNPKSDYPLTSFPVGVSYPNFNTYWVHPVAPLNPNSELYAPVETTPVFNGTNWEQAWEFAEKTPSPPILNWDGLYQGLMVSTVYSELVALGQQHSGIDGALDKTIDSIQYGIFKPESIAALPAFQSAINLLLMVLTGAGQGLSVEQLTEVRSILDANNFQEITL